MTVVRNPAVAGTFYPDDAGALEADVRRYVDAAETGDTAPKAIIVPHAGYVYSGSIAGSGYARLKSARNTIRRVVLLGPAHFVQLQGLAACHADEFSTPLGTVKIDQEAMQQLDSLPQVQVLDAAHAREHSLEVHLPFLQVLLDDFQLVPLVVGQATPEEVAEVIERLWGGPETLFVISSDLSHYQDYETAAQLDRETSRAIETMRLEDLRADRACGFLPISGLLSVARKRGLRARLIDLRNSGDTAGPRDRVVGYGAYVIEEGSPAMAAEERLESAEGPTVEHQNVLLDVARKSIDMGIAYGSQLLVSDRDYPHEFQQPRATFVTLRIAKKLRGCMGSLIAKQSLIADVAQNAYSAAFRDPRFPSLSREEATTLEIHISILSPAVPIEFTTQQDLLEKIRPGIDGLTLCEGTSRGTLLPSVWENIPDAHQFLEQLKLKAGLEADYWSETVSVERYTAISVPHKP